MADACRDLTAQVARRGGASVVAVQARNVGTARAAGVREVLHRTRHLDPADVWLATTDADSVVPAGWLRQQARYADQGWDAVAGTYLGALRASQRVFQRHGLRLAMAGAGRLGGGGPRRRPRVTR